MFEHIVLRRAEGGHPISAGQIAEALLYYQKIHIFIDRGTLFQLIKQIGTKCVLTLLNRAEVSAVYCEETLGTHTNFVGVSQCHNYVAFTLAGHEKVGELKNPAERMQYELGLQGISKNESKRFTKCFLSIVPIRKFSGNYFLQGGIPGAAKCDVLDIDFAKQAIRAAIAVAEGGYQVDDDLKLEIIDTESGFYVFTNVDLDSINLKRSKSAPPTEPLTIAHVLSNILDARADLALAAFYGGDFVTSAVTSAIIQARHAELLRRSNINRGSREQFVDIVLPDTPKLAEVIDAGERSFEEFLVLLDRSVRFKSWLSVVNPDEDLIRTYMRDISTEGWIQKLPAKSVRYVLAQALESANPVLGIVFGLFDNFLVEKIFSGWRPSHFVTKRLSQFVQRN